MCIFFDPSSPVFLFSSFQFFSVSPGATVPLVHPRALAGVNDQNRSEWRALEPFALSASLRPAL